MSSNKIRVLIIDDSSVIRKLLQRILSSDPEIEVVGIAPDPYVGRELLVQHKPDVITLDIEMPKMDGLSFLEKVMQHMPTRTIVVSSLAQAGSETALRALELGAIDVIEKPSLDVMNSLELMKKQITERVKAVSRARLIIPQPRAVTSSGDVANKVAKIPVAASLAKTTHQLIAIASSTGGTEALKAVLKGLPSDLPGTVIVQHMPAGFTKTYAESLNKLFPFQVREAQDGDKVVPGLVLIAPGNFHMELERRGGYYHVKLHQEPMIHGVRPAADFLMKSVAKHAGKNAIGIVLTGMGKDGAEGLLEMHKAGAYTIAQNEATCVVFGMPQAAIQVGAVDSVLALNHISSDVVNYLKKSAA